MDTHCMAYKDHKWSKGHPRASGKASQWHPVPFGPIRYRSRTVDRPHNYLNLEDVPASRALG